MTLKYPLLVRPRNQEPSRFGDQLSPYYLHDKELTLFAYSSTSYCAPRLNLNCQDMEIDSDDNNKNDPDVIHFQSVNSHWAHLKTKRPFMILYIYKPHGTTYSIVYTLYMFSNEIFLAIHISLRGSNRVEYLITPHCY